MLQTMSYCRQGTVYMFAYMCEYMFACEREERKQCVPVGFAEAFVQYCDSTLFSYLFLGAEQDL